MSKKHRKNIPDNAGTPAAGRPIARAGNISRLLELLPLFLIIAFVIFVRMRLLSFPLERDEGEYAYMGQLILHGIPPYKIAYNMKFPGIYFIYAFIMALFGQTTHGIHIGLLLANITSMILLFLISKKLVNRMAGLIASATYGVLSLSPSVLGFAGHATQFVTPFALGGVLYLLKAFSSDNKRFYAVSGALFAVSILMKQVGVFFALFAVSAILFRHLSQRPKEIKKLFINSVVFSAGLFLPMALTLLYLWTAGVYDKFWFWNFKYLSSYAASPSLREALDLFKEKTLPVINGFYLIWAGAAAGLIAAFFGKELKGKRFLIISFSIFAFLTILPGAYFRKHYYITFLPALSLLTGLFFYRLGSLIKAEYIAVFLFLASLFAGMQNQGEYLFVKDPSVLCKEIYNLQPFVESTEIAKFIKLKTKPEDTIGIFGSEPQILFYSNRKSATGYIYTYSLMEYQSDSLKMQKEMIKEIESNNPKIFIDIKCKTSWQAAKDSETYIFRWARDYIPAHYNLAGIIEIFSDTAIYRWGKDAEGYRSKHPFRVLVYERR